MYVMFVYGILVGIGGTLLMMELTAMIRRYQDRQQAEFEAAVQAAAAHRRNQAERDWDRMLDNGWSHVEPTDSPRHPSKVRKFAFDKTEDPFA